MAKLIWTLRAVEDIEQICTHIEISSKHYARTFAESIIARIESLPKSPFMGQVVPEYRQENLRERLFQGYRIIYRVLPGAVQLVCVVHGARQLPATPPGEASR